MALITDNRITLGGGYSDLGNYYMLSWTTPNLSISSAMHRSDLRDASYQEYRKELLKFSFGISNEDLDYYLDDVMLAFGVAVKRLSDQLFSDQVSDFGGDAISMDFGFHITWQYSPGL